MLTQKHYKAIAEIIRDGIDEEENAKGCGIAVHIAAKLAAFFANDNEQFDRKRFAAACKPENMSFIKHFGQTEDEYFDI